MSTSTVDAAVGAQVKLVRIARGLSVDQIAEALSSDAATVADQEAGRRRFSGRDLFRLAKLLQVPFRRFYAILENTAQDAELADEHGPICLRCAFARPSETSAARGRLHVDCMAALPFWVPEGGAAHGRGITVTPPHGCAAFRPVKRTWSVG